MCRDLVETRHEPTVQDGARTGVRLMPGEVFFTDQEVARGEGGCSFHRLADGRGWVFERLKGMLVTAQVSDFERGLWHYQVLHTVELREAPSYSDDLRVGETLEEGENVAIDERCQVANARFLKLADGRGWLFETTGDIVVCEQINASPARPQRRDFERGLWHYQVVCDQEVEVRAVPTYSDDARTGQYVQPREIFAVDERCRLLGTWFVKLADGRGWLFESKQETLVLQEVR